MNGTEQKERRDAIKDLRAFVGQKVDEMDKSAITLFEKHADQINKNIVEHHELTTKVLSKVFTDGIEKIKKEMEMQIEVVHTKAIAAEAIHHRKFWGRLKWLVSGK